MAHQWFRMYHEVVDDPKVQRLSPIIFRAWVNFLCIAKKHGGALPDIADIAYRLHITKLKAEYLQDELVKANLFEWKDGVCRPHNWEGRQFKTDDVNERVKRFRNGKKNVTKRKSETLHETLDETDQNRTDTDSPQPPEGQTPKVRPPDLAYELFREAYQAHYQGTPYMPTSKQKQGDFVQLAELRKGLSVEHLAVPPDWAQACANYFATLRKKHTLADLCVDYPTYRIARLDRFDRPVGMKAKAATPEPIC